MKKYAPKINIHDIEERKEKKILTFITAFANHLMERVKEAFSSTPPSKNSSTQNAKLFMHTFFTPNFQMLNYIKQYVPTSE